MFITSQTWGVLAALDNFDYDPSTTFVGSLHGTGRSIIQCPRKENRGLSRSVTPVGEAYVINLPDEYTFFPLCL